MRLSTIELFHDQLKFSAGHFVILASNKRERLHGHNFAVYAAITSVVSDNGMTFDYRLYKQKLLTLCRSLNEYFLLPSQSPHLQIEQHAEHTYALFNGERIPFLNQDLKILPIRNITVEELSNWFIEQLLQDTETITHYAVRAITIKISTSPGRYGSTTWEQTDNV